MAKILFKGNGVNPGMARGKLKKVTDKVSSLDVVDGDIVYSESFLPPLPSLARKAAGFILKSASEADHAISYLKEIWKPCILVDDLSVFESTTQEIYMDGTTGEVSIDSLDSGVREIYLPLKHKIKTKIYLQQSIPWMSKKAVALNTDGVGLLRTNLIIEETAKHPYFYFIKQNKDEELVDILFNGIKEIADAFSPKPVWLRTMDFATDELLIYEKGESEKREDNPLLGWRGLIRVLEQPELLSVEYRVIKKLLESGCTNIGMIYPMVRDVTEYRLAKKILKEHDIEPHKDIKVGSMFETPSAAMQIDDFIESGLDLAFIGINDITQYTLAADRTNSQMQRVYNPINDSILKLVYNILEKCKANNIETTTSFLAPFKKILPELLAKGMDGFTLQADKINEVAELIKKAENI